LEPLKNVPDDAIFQYCTNRGYLENVNKELTPEHVSKLPGSKNILRTHMGSQWQQERYSLVAKRYAEMMQTAYKTGMQGCTIFAEPGAFNTVNEINYLAFARFGYSSDLSFDQFVEKDLAPILGGKDKALQYLNFLDPKNLGDVKALQLSIDAAREIAASVSGECYRRWVWLQNHLFQKLNMSGHTLNEDANPNLSSLKEINSSKHGNRSVVLDR